MAAILTVTAMELGVNNITRVACRFVGILGLTMCWASSTMAAEWWYVTESKDTVYFADRSTIAPVTIINRPYKRAWIASFKYKDAIKAGGESSRKTLQYFICADRSTDTKSIITYKADGDVLASQTMTDYQISWDPAAPGTVSDAWLNFICNSEQGEGESEKFAVEGMTFFYVNDLDAAAKILTASSPKK